MAKLGTTLTPQDETIGTFENFCKLDRNPETNCY